MRTIESTEFYPFLLMAQINAATASKENDPVKMKRALQSIADDLEQVVRGIQGTQDEALLDLQAALEGKDD